MHIYLIMNSHTKKLMRLHYIYEYKRNHLMLKIVAIVYYLKYNITFAEN